MIVPRRQLILCALTIVGLLFIPVTAGAEDVRFEAMVAEAKAAMLVDPAKAIEPARLAQQFAESATEPRERAMMRATARWLLGEAYSRAGWDGRAEPLVEFAVQESQRLDPFGRLHADALMSRGTIRVGSGNVSGAITDLHAAHKLFRRLGDPRSQARAFALIANIYYLANDWSTALRYYDQALDAYRADPGLAVSIRNGRGLTLKEMRKLPAASREFKIALSIARRMNSPVLTATVLSNSARAALLAGRIAVAERDIAEGLQLAGISAPAPLRKELLDLSAQAAYRRGDLNRAASLSEQVFADTDLTKTTLLDREAHRTAYETFRRLGRHDVALQHLIAWKRLDDEATKLARSNSAALMAARFDFANQELRIAKLKAVDLEKSVAFERARIRTQRLVAMAGVGLVLIIIAMLAFGIVTLRRSRDRVRAANVDLEATNAALGKALQAKTEFLATTSHEIRTPLNGILGMTEVMLSDARLEQPTRERVALVHDAGLTMRALVDDILDAAKIDSGKLKIESTAYDFSETVSGAARMWREQAVAKGLDFEVDLTDAPGLILGDPARVRQIVFNLLSNAIKFTERGSIRISVNSVDDRVRVTVADSGIGVATEKLEQIFETFRQADSGTTRKYGGTGLGLSICRSLAQAMGGDVSLTSEIDAGSIFTLDLPLIAAPANTTRPAPADPGRVALIIDRNPITRSMMKAMIAPHTGTIVIAAGIEEAVVELGSIPATVIIVDDATARAASGNGLDGPMVSLRKAAAEARIALLWSQGPNERVETLEAVADLVVLARPVDKSQLLAVLFDEPIGEPDVTLAARAA